MTATPKNSKRITGGFAYITEHADATGAGFVVVETRNKANGELREVARFEFDATSEQAMLASYRAKGVFEAIKEA